MHACIHTYIHPIGQGVYIHANEEMLRTLELHSDFYHNLN
jgi:hypothetical protein